MKLSALTLCGLTLGALGCQADTAITMPLEATETSVFNAIPNTINFRSIKYNLTDPKLASNTSSQYPAPNYSGLNTNAFGVLADAVAFSTAIGNFSYAGPDYVVSCEQGGSTTGSGGSGLIVYAQMLVMARTTNASDDLAGRILPLLKAAPTVTKYALRDVNVKYTVAGGKFDGKVLTLPATLAYGSGRNPNDDPSVEEHWVGDMFLAIDWGSDPLGNREMALIRWTYEAAATTEDSTCLPLMQVAQNYFGEDTVAGYFTPKWDALMAEADTGAIQLQGSIPELLYLYDFTGQKSVLPSQTVPPGDLDSSTVISPYFYQPDTNEYAQFNQYDAGVAFGLPSRFNPPNPVPFPSGFTPGGNACGPTSLGMLLFAYGLSDVDHPTVYDNTTQHGLNVAANAANEFDFDRAKEWLGGQDDYDFTADSPLPAGSTASYIYADDGASYTAANITRAWGEIDALLDKKQPVVYRSDFGFGTGTGLGSAAGGGHCVLLLGRGHNDGLTDIYGGSGDYYIVGDPAGNWCANNNGTHYGTVTKLLTQNLGINYGGWFAMYPKELVRQHIWDKNNNVFRVTGLTVGEPFHRPALRATVHSPLTMIITDPMGRQAGVRTNGANVANIPSSQYVRASIDEEETGASSFPADGPKAIQIDDPMDGIYQLDLIATNAGSYRLDWQILNAAGMNSGSFQTSNTVVTGQELHFTIAVTNGDAPTLQLTQTNGAIQMYWPTNAAGYALQSSTNLGSATNWAAAALTPGTTSNGLYAATNTPGNGQKFFRLKK
jgi:hypothetical protein